MGFQGKIKGRRKAPYPNSILDRKALTEALEEAGISVKRMHMDEFYKALHKQHYPPLAQFVENYYANEEKISRPPRLQPKPQLQEEKSEKENTDQINTGTGTDTDTKQNNNNNNNNILVENANKNNKNDRKTRNKLTLPRVLLDYVANTPDFVHTTSRVKEQFTSADQSTTKLIIELYDGFVVESVLMRYRQKGAGRASLCVSSQCGCAMGCTFCATGTMGKRVMMIDDPTVIIVHCSVKRKQ